MYIYHNSHDEDYRRPFGAAEISSRVFLACDAREAKSVTLRLWCDETGEILLPMERNGERFAAEVEMPSRGCLLWYYFIAEDEEGNIGYYGNNRENLGGEGEPGEVEPPSFQITVYRPAPVPEWYKNALVYQIFPDRFRRGKDWRERVAAAAGPEERRGPRRVIQEDWNDTPFYTRDGKNGISRWPFFGGTLSGVREKLPYLRSIGVTAIYFNPIFRAASNHRYDTADYCSIDPMLGDEDDFRELCREARRAGISVILDGVFSHTGADSIYFDRNGNWGGKGAYGNESSPYRGWYRFTEDEGPGYECWWGVEDLPNVEETEPGYQEFICGANGVIRRWLTAGARGWRLDVADELPDSFISAVRKAVKAGDPEGVLIGEVWEDASNKRSYDVQRRYLLGDELDAAMNYPFREMMLDFVMGRSGANALMRRMFSLMENYPPENFYAAFNIVGSHDRVRILTLLGDAPEDLPESERESYRLSPRDYEKAVRRLKLLSVLQYASPGVPCVYYGDEAGMQGYSDPYNRGTYPWGREDGDLLYHYRMLGLIYHEHSALRDGDFKPLPADEEDRLCAFLREDEEERILVLANPGETAAAYSVPLEDGGRACELLSGTENEPRDGVLSLTVPPCTAMLVLLQPEPPARGKLSRSAGVICPLSALPGSGERGRSGADVYRFLDFLEKAGQKIWQILPLNPAGLGNSPYMSPAVFAGDSALINPEEKEDESGFQAFCEDNCYWLEDYALYTALKEKFAGRPWQEWPGQVRDRNGLDRYREELAPGMERIMRAQYGFFSQWDRVRDYAHDRGISIVGDLPVYAAPDSADTWAHRELFQLDENGFCRMRAGVPPDYFSPEGQDWGNPLYDWDAMRRDGFRWWIERLRLCKSRYDYVRLDHFRSFSAYFAIPAGRAAKEGTWQPGAGMEFFRALRRELGDVGIIAEDLGALDAGVKDLLRQTGFPGMDVWQFTSEEMMSMTPEEAENRVFYSGTHDNQTLLGWCGSRREAERIIHDLYMSSAPWVILQLQDMLSLGDEARINTPGTAEGNWTWRADAAMLSEETAARYRELAQEAERQGKQGEYW